MAEKVHPATNTISADKPTAVNGGANPGIPLPPTRAQLYNRPVYRPQPPSPKKRRSCCRSCCLFTTLIIVVILLLAAISGAVIYLIYRPHRPSFEISSFQVSQFNLTSTQYSSKFNFTLTARNPNKKIKFFYEPVTITTFSDNGVDIAYGSFPEFMLDTKNTTSLQTVLESPPNLSSGDLSTLQSELKKNSLPLNIQMDTKMRVKIGSLKTKKMRLRVKCNGVKLNVPGGKPASVGITSDVKCKVDLRVKIWKWTV